MLISYWSDLIKPFAADGLRNRERVLTEFQNLLTKRRHDPDFKEALVAHLVNLDQMRTLDFQKKIDYNTDVTFKLFMRIDRSLNPTHPAYLLKRTGTLATDFEKLSCDPVQIKPKQYRYRGSHRTFERTQKLLAKAAGKSTRFLRWSSISIQRPGVCQTYR